MILDTLREELNARFLPWAKGHGLDRLPLYALEEPPPEIAGDVACNLALLLAKSLKKSPRILAEELRKAVEGKLSSVDRVSVAGAGFLNFAWKMPVLQVELQTVLRDGATYGRHAGSAGKKVLIEFVSANPTGPLHVGHGRGAALGDSLGLILAHLGCEVTREYYVNDAGNQVFMLGQSVEARALELEGKSVIFPENGYHGDYVKDLAKGFLAEVPAAQRSPEKVIAWSVAKMTANIKEDLEAFGVHFDSWFSEASLLKKGLVDQHLKDLSNKGFVKEEDGAVWFVAPKPSSPAGTGRGSMAPPLASGGVDSPPGAAGNDDQIKDKDRVLKKRDGKWTYFATDIAYHADKFERGFQELIDVWGADHHGYVPRVKGSMQALGYNADQLHVILNQMVALTRNGAPVVMSKRAGEFITLREVLDEVGKDACRFFFAMRGPNTPLDFDLELAKKHTADNPVYYLQYAHARICSIQRQAGAAWSGSPPFNLLVEKEERDLMKRLALFGQVLLVCEHEDSPHPLANYLMQLARQFHHFYDHHRVLGDHPALTQARLGLLTAVRTLLQKGLSLLGVNAPESM